MGRWQERGWAVSWWGQRAGHLQWFQCGGQSQPLPTRPHMGLGNCTPQGSPASSQDFGERGWVWVWIGQAGTEGSEEIVSLLVQAPLGPQ